MLQFPNILIRNIRKNAVLSSAGELVHEAIWFALSVGLPEKRKNDEGAGLKSGNLGLFLRRSRRSISPSRCLLHSAFFTLFALIVCAQPAGLAQQSDPTAQSPVDEATKLLDEGKPREALALLLQISERGPTAPALEAKLGKAYFQLHEFSQAKLHLNSAVQHNADDLESSQLLALSFYYTGDCRSALPLLEKVGPRLPTNIPDAPYVIAICYVMTEHLDNARKSLAQMFSVAPDSAMAYLTLGKLLVRQHKVEAAVPPIETALRLQPRIAMAHFLLGEIDLYQSNLQDAVAEFQKELAVNPTMWLVYWRLGDAYMRLAKYDDAESVLKKAIWLNEASPGAFVLLGEIALKKNDPALASGFLERALAIDPQNPDAHYALATAYKALGRDTEANQQLEISKKLRNEKQDREKDKVEPLP